MYVFEKCAEGIFVTFPWWLENVKSRSKIALFSNECHFEIWFPEKGTITFFWSKLSKLHKKDPILHVATTFSLKQGETKTSHGPIPHPLNHLVFYIVNMIVVSIPTSYLLKFVMFYYYCPVYLWSLVACMFISKWISVQGARCYTMPMFYEQWTWNQYTVFFGSHSHYMQVFIRVIIKTKEREREALATPCTLF